MKDEETVSAALEAVEEAQEAAVRSSATAQIWPRLDRDAIAKADKEAYRKARNEFVATLLGRSDLHSAFRTYLDVAERAIEASCLAGLSDRDEDREEDERLGKQAEQLREVLIRTLCDARNVS